MKEKAMEGELLSTVCTNKTVLVIWLVIGWKEDH